MSEQKFLTVNEVAQRLSLHPGTVYRLIKQGSIPHFRVGSKIRVREDALEALGVDSGTIAGDDK